MRRDWRILDLKSGILKSHLLLLEGWFVFSTGITAEGLMFNALRIMYKALKTIWRAGEIAQ